MRQPLAEPDAAQQLLGARPRLGHRHPRDPHRHLGVLERGEFRQQVMKLEDEADAGGSGTRRPRRRGSVGQTRAADRDPSLVDAIEPAEHVQQRALADA